MNIVPEQSDIDDGTPNLNFGMSGNLPTSAEYYAVDVDLNLAASQNNQLYSLMRFRDRGNDDAIAGVRRLMFTSENDGGGQFHNNAFELGYIVGYASGASTISDPTAHFEAHAFPDNVGDWSSSAYLFAGYAHDAGAGRAGAGIASITRDGAIRAGTLAGDSSAVLQADSTTQGFLPPRMTTAERDAIGTPATGLMVYNTTTDKLNFFNSAAWEAVTSA